MSIAVTREYGALIPILERMQVPDHGVLVVHSAIATLSRQGFRAEAMIEVLLDYMRHGTVAMPTMTWRTVTPEQPTWDELNTPSHTGVLTEVFRTRYADARSIHPTHSVAAYGPQARRLVARHHLDDTPVSANSPYGLMRETPAYVLFLGVGLESCTAIHFPEEAVAPDVYVRPPEQVELYQCRDRHGVVHQVRTRRHWRLDRDFPKFGAPLQRAGVMSSGNLDGCPYAVVALADLLDAVFAALAADPRGTLRNQSFTSTEK
ncbi:MAG: AAC(3) family N-acetyltransferase [Xanthobacteraceae bacterium]|jgi:aminoglycoside 3-N-acetyltransferase